MNRLRRYSITGLVLVVPVVLTVYVLVLGFQFVDGLLGVPLNRILRQTLGFAIPGAGFLLFMILIIGIGFLANRFVGKRLFPRLERWFLALPFVAGIYPAFKQMVSFMFTQHQMGFRSAVLVEYPSKGMWTLGFLTSEKQQAIDEAAGTKLLGVFVPNSPNPLTGYLVFFPKTEVRSLALPVRDAIRLVVSCGVFNPQNNNSASGSETNS